MYKQIDSNKRNSVILIIVFFLVLGGLGYVFDLFYGSGQGYFPYVGVIIAIVFSLVMTSVSYFSGDKIALKSSGAKEIKQADNPYVYRMVENMAITAGIKTPRVYIIEDSSINAFATGRKPELSSIAVTTGAIEKLENEELEGVIAHEMSHVKNYDIRFMMLVAVLVGSIAILSDMFLRISFFGGGKSSDKKSGHPAMIIIGLVFVILSPIIANLVKLAISRKREYLADASGSLLTRYPEGLARALEKIGRENQPMKKKSKATAHLFIANPFQGKFSTTLKPSGKVKHLFSTHPPLADRVRKLREM